MVDEKEQPRPDPLIGATLSERYTLMRKIGEGGMGAVYEGTHIALGKSVAVKVLREKYADRPTVAQRLVQEARLASGIRHEHIIDITDSGKTEDGRTFVVMELLEGESLAELLRREGPLPEARVIELMRQVAGALGAAHARGIVHRDVKPENIFLVKGRDGDFIKVLDFGISTVMRESREGDVSPEADTESMQLRLTSTGMVLGTPFYMSPEQARGDEAVDLRIDIYAMGIILYEALTGEVPFRGANYLGIISRVLNDSATRPRALRPELRISEAMERVVLKAMAKAREDRYPSMEALEADLVRVLAGEGVDAPAPPPVEAGGPQSRAWIVAAAAMALIGGAALLWAGRSPPAPAPAQPRPAPVAVGPAPPPAPKTVILHVKTDPPGAEVRQGDRVFGVTPWDVVLPRSNAPTQLTFHLDGYEPGIAPVVPATDDEFTVKLTKKPKPRPVTRPAAKKPTDAPSEPQKPNGETKPNPYK